MEAFNNDAAIKNKFLARVKAHAAADEIIKGTYWERGKGCAVGCTIHGDDHAAYERELFLPEWLARLEDTIFEGLPDAEAKKFPLQFLEAIPVGAKLDRVKWQFCAFVMRENIERVFTLEIADNLKKQVVDSIRGVLALHEKAAETGEWDESAALSARSATWSAWSAAWSARSARSALSAAGAAAGAAWSAAWSARSARLALSAARSATWSAGAAALSARSATYIRYRDELLRLLTRATEDHGAK